MTDLTVKLNKTIHAPIETVFDAWLDPKLLARFILPAPGMPEPKVENDPQEGGKFVIIMEVGDDKIPHSGEYLEVNRPERLVFTWASPCSIDDSTVTLEFSAIDQSTTEIKLTHIRFIDEETRSDHEGGWSNILDKLDEITS
ncbi:MAG TPA: SRPBCC domain-containing protein [Gammaproteobacteria bacterium]|nr:SRPBCC domain-containing protein [Gammaproteobacteria bacterium]